MAYKILNLFENVYSVQTEWGEILRIQKPLPELSDEQMVSFIQDVVDFAQENKFFSLLTEKSASLQKFKLESLSFLHSVPVNALYEEEIRTAKLVNVANIILQNPNKYKGVLFNGSELPNCEQEILERINLFLEDYVTKNIKAEEILQHFNNKINELSFCKTFDDINKVRW